MSTPSKQPATPEWVERFRADPRTALDELLRGLARVHPYERATPSEILKRLFGTLPAEDPDRVLLDTSLRDWLAGRRIAMTPEQRLAYGLPRFVTETMDALAAVWLVGLPQSAAWLQDHYLELAQWMAPLRLSEVWDLPRALAMAAALTQHDQRLRLHWLRLCKDAAAPSRRDLTDPALQGLSRLPGTAGHGASPELIGGLARFGAALEATPRDRLDFMRRWRAIKARFPRTGKTWQRHWQPALTDARYKGRPFVDWLTVAEPALRRQWSGPARIVLPPDITGMVAKLIEQARSADRRPKVLTDAERLLANLDQYAEATGDAYFFVRSACNLGNDVLHWAPGHVLAWARAALRWSPGNGHAWDLRARALDRLGRPDLAQSVYWEATRRLPDNAVVRNQLALHLLEQDRASEAEALFREAQARDPRDATARVELARLLARTGREPEAEALLRRTLQELDDDAVAPYTLALLLIAWGRAPEAVPIRDRYVRRFGRNRWSQTLDRLIAAAEDGAAKAQHRLGERELHAEEAEPAVAADAEAAEREGELEREGAEPLRRAAIATRADLLFRLADVAAAEERLAGLLAADADDLYPQIVWALHAAERRGVLGERYRETFGALAPHLAAAAPDTPAVHWERLLAAFPERTGLIDFARLMRSGIDAAAAQRLEQWLGSGEGDDFLRVSLHRELEREGGISPNSQALRNLLDIGILAEVDLGDRMLGIAA